jgi:crossover junction endodeoxyribonuclease RuvC
MFRKNSKILAIDPGTRVVGIALLEDNKLIYHGVKTIKKETSPHETLKTGKRIILRLIEDFRPNTIVVENAFFSNNRNVALLNVFVDEIKSIAQSKRLRILSFAPNTVKKQICGYGRARKRDVARVIVSKFPELKVYLTQDRVWKETYHQNMFDAVALGVMAGNNSKI